MDRRRHLYIGPRGVWDALSRHSENLFGLKLDMRLLKSQARFTMSEVRFSRAFYSRTVA